MSGFRIEIVFFFMQEKYLKKIFNKHWPYIFVQSFVDLEIDNITLHIHISRTDKPKNMLIYPCEKTSFSF